MRGSENFNPVLIFNNPHPITCDHQNWWQELNEDQSFLSSPKLAALWLISPKIIFSEFSTDILSLDK